MIDITKISQHRIMLVAATLIILWNISAWFIAERYYLSESTALIKQETTLAQQRANDLADSIRRNLSYLHGIPDLFSKLLRVQWAVSRFGADVTPSTLPVETRIRQWTHDPALKDLSQYLDIARKGLNTDLICVMNAAGDAIAASNWDTAGSPIGNNYSERDFFKKNKTGERGMQYAVGKTTHIAGLYFSTPVILDNKFMGAVVAKIDVPNLSFLIRQVDAFVTDTHGVIILARDQSIEMHAFPGASISKLTDKEKFTRYRRTDFPALNIAPWENGKLNSLLRVENDNVPHILASQELPEYGITIHINRPLDSIPSLKNDRVWLTALIGAFGTLLLLAASSTMLYFRSIIRSKTLLWKQANFDTLTNLPNRDMFQYRLAQEMKKSDRSGLPLALLLIDLDHFKEVNDTLGHDMGDLLLKEAAHRILHCVRESDTVARLGGDEYSIVLAQLADVPHIEEIARKIIACLAEPFQLGSEITHVSASLGITIYPHDAVDIDNLRKNADQAMYVAKNNGRNRFSYFTVALQEAAQKRLRLTNDLRGALTAKQFMVYFQPIIELSTGHTRKAEALLRWLHPIRGMVNPLEFIPLAEETGLIIDIGEWIRNESATWCKRWNTLWPEGFQMSVNLSPVEFMDESGHNSIGIFLNHLHEHGMSGKNFVFEITEGLLLNVDSGVAGKLIALRDAGIQVAIDDFGTGYSSLSYLKKLDIDYLKIDQSFIRNLENDSNDMALCEAIIVMAHKLGLKVIAEGVETEQQRELLTHAGCDYAQGYLFSSPLPPEEFDAWLKDRNHAVGTSTL